MRIIVHLGDGWMNLSQMNVVTDATAAAAVPAAALLVIQFICMRVGYDGIIIIVIGRTDGRTEEEKQQSLYQRRALIHGRSVVTHVTDTGKDTRLASDQGKSAARGKSVYLGEEEEDQSEWNGGKWESY